MTPLDTPPGAAPVAHPDPVDSALWSVDRVAELFELPFSDLIHRAQSIHREHFDPNAVQLSTLLSIKTGGCPEDCAYCPQSVRYQTGVQAQDLMPFDVVVSAARAAKEAGATRFCMGAAWRGPKDKELEPVLDMVRAVKGLGLETCATLGMLREGQAEKLKHAGLDYYNHNLDTAPEFYGDIITTREYDDRLDTLGKVRSAGINVCCGGIVGMGESRRERAGLIAQLASFDPQPSRSQSTISSRSRARRCTVPIRSIRSSSSARSPWPALRCRARTCACPPAVSRCPKRFKRCASWPARIRSSTVTSC